MGEATMAGAAWGDRHRRLSIKKVENGYEVEAAFLVEKHHDNGVPYQHQEHRSYVFYTIEEALDFAKNYFDAEQSEIRKVD